VAQQHFLDHQTGLDGLAQPDVVGDEQRYPGHPEGLGDRLELVVLDGDARTERRLQRLVVGTRDGSPAHGVEEGPEHLRVIPTGGRHVGQSGLREDLPSRLDLPGDGQLLAEVVVADAGERDQRPARWFGGELVPRLRGGAAPVDDPLLAADPDQLTDLRCEVGGSLREHLATLAIPPVWRAAVPGAGDRRDRSTAGVDVVRVARRPGVPPAAHQVVQ